MHEVLVMSKGERLIYLEQAKLIAGQEQVMFAKGIIEVLLNRPFYILFVNAATVDIDLPEPMVIGRSRDTLCTIFDFQVSIRELQEIDEQNMIKINLISI